MQGLLPASYRWSKDGHEQIYGRVNPLGQDMWLRCTREQAVAADVLAHAHDPGVWSAVPQPCPTSSLQFGVRSGVATEWPRVEATRKDALVLGAVLVKLSESMPVMWGFAGCTSTVSAAADADYIRARHYQG